MLIRCPHCQKNNRIPELRLADDPRCGACGESILNHAIDADASILQQALEQNQLPVIVDFWAPWCGPCLSFAPTFTAAASKHAGELLFLKVNTEAEQAIAASYNIRSIPTLAVFYKQQELGRVSGALPAAQLEQLIQQVKTQTQPES